MRKVILIGFVLCLFLISGCGETCSGMSYSEAVEIAEESDCVSEGSLLEERSCNAVTKTWWIELDIEKENCNPACVINAESRSAEINWRCTGAVQKLTGGAISITGGVGDTLEFKD